MVAVRNLFLDRLYNPKIFVVSLGCWLFVTGCGGNLQQVPVKYSESALKLDKKPIDDHSTQVHDEQNLRATASQATEYGKVDLPPPPQTIAGESSLVVAKESESLGEASKVIVETKTLDAPIQRVEQGSRGGDLEVKLADNPPKTTQGASTPWYKSAGEKVAGFFGGKPETTESVQNPVNSVGNEPSHDPSAMSKAEVLGDAKGDGSREKQEAGPNPSSGKDSPGTGESSVEEKQGLLAGAGHYFKTIFSSPPPLETSRKEDGVKPQGATDFSPSSEGGLPLDTGSASSFEETAPWQSGGAANKGQGYYVELGGLSDGASADKMVKRLKSLNVPFLLQQARVDGALVHRVYVGPFADRKDAQTMATDLAKRKIQAGSITNQIN